MARAVTFSSGGSGDDFLDLGADSDLAAGGAGNDHIKGKSGEDTLHGGAGADILEGNEDSDLFVYSSASDSSISQPDTIVDFAVGSDKLLLHFPSYSPVEVGAVDSLEAANAYFDVNVASIQAAFSASESILYIDSDAQGVADMAINLESVTSLSVSDFSSAGTYGL